MASSHDSTVKPRWDGVPEHWGKGHYRDIPWSHWVLKCRERQINDLKRSQANDPDFPYVFDWQKSEDAVWFFSCLRHFQSPFYGQPFILSDWQEWDIIRPLFGWMKRDGTRRFKEANIFIPKKNGKSPLAAGIAGILFLADKEYGGQVVTAAGKEDQAKIVWDAARRMMDLSPELRDEYKTFKRALANEVLGSRFFYLGKDSKGNDGLNLNGAVVDEYHAHKTSEMKDIVRQAMASRLQPLCVTITTLGYGERTPCDDEFEISKSILDGRIKDESYFAFLTTVDDPEKWDDEVEWQKANPGLGISISIDRLREDFQTANLSPRKREEFKCKRLNIKGKKYGNWIPMERFKAGRTEINWEHWRGKRCFGGLDLGISRDLSAAAFVFQEDKVATMDESGKLILPKIYIKMLLWVPEVGLEERYKSDGVPYAQWVEQGFIIATPGETRRSDIIRRDIREKVLEQYDVAEIAADQSNAHELMTNMADDGATVVKHSQSFYAMNFPCSSFETAVIDGRIYYDNPVIEWCLSNVAILRNAEDQIKIAKDKSRGRVDPIVALCMGLGRLMIAPEPTNFVYNFMGIYSK